MNLACSVVASHWWRDVVEDDLEKGRLDKSLAKDRERWKAQIMGKTSDLCEHGKRDVK